MAATTGLSDGRGALREKAQERDDVVRLLRRALLVRVVLALALHLWVPESFFAPDQAGYHSGAQLLAGWWSGESALYPARLLGGQTPAGYYYIVGMLYYLIGPWSLLPKLVNSLIGAYSVQLVYNLAHRLIGHHAGALRAATVTAFMPSMVLWSVLNIRDAWVILILLLICNVVVPLQSRLSFTSLGILAACLLALNQFRAYLVLPVVLAILIALAIKRGITLVRLMAVALVVAGVVSYLDVMGGPGRRISSADLEILQEIREGTASGGRSNFMPDADISTPASAIVFLPLGLVFFLFAPFPWSITGFRQLVTLPEMIFFYSLVPSMVRGAFALLRSRTTGALSMLLITAALTFGYALGQSNAGTAYRHRAQVMPFLLILAARGRGSRTTADAGEAR